MMRDTRTVDGTVDRTEDRTVVSEATRGIVVP